MKTKKYFTAAISILLILCLILCGLLFRKNQRLQQGFDETLALNLLSIDELIGQDMDKLKVFDLYFDENKFTNFYKNNYSKYDTQLRTIHAVAISDPAYEDYDLKELRYYLFDLHVKADDDTLTKDDLAQLLAIFSQWQSFAWEQLGSSNEAGSQREYYKFKDDKADVKGSIHKILDLIPESAL